MSLDVIAWAAPSAGAPLVKQTITLAPLAADEVEVAITHCGVCASDWHLAEGHWGPFSSFPGQVCGHEIVGTVRALGPLARGLALGQRVGIGWWKSACERCEPCLRGDQAVCAETVPTCAGGAKGGFAEAIRVRAAYAFPIPDALPSAAAAPLLCGGVTVFHPLQKYAPPGARVGVVGIGGLGHLAILFAAARGCVVTAISSGESKRALAAELGASAFINCGGDGAALDAAADSLDVVLFTGGADALEHGKLVKLLRRNGVLVYAGVHTKPVVLDAFSDLLAKQITVTGTAAGGRASMAAMLRFAADKRIVPITQLHAFDDVNAALKSIADNTVRFRAVLARE